MLKIIQIFKALHIHANLKQAIASLKGKSGIYCIRHIASGTIYIGQTVDLSVRIMQHIKGSHSNIHLKRAIEKYDLEAFEFIVVEFVEDTSLLTTSEQVHLDWLFSVSSELRYNICPTAESPLGITRTAATKALMSERKSGGNNPMAGKTHTAESKALMSERISGGNNPMTGKTHTAESIDANRINQPNRVSIFVYDHETRKLVGEFPSQVAAAGGLKVSPRTVRNYLVSGKVLNNKYIIRTSIFPPPSP